jgi:putative transposase
MSDHFQKEIAFVGRASSPAFIRAPEGYGCNDRFIRTLKENLLWVRHVKRSRNQGRRCSRSGKRYNETCLIERHRFLTAMVQYYS